MISILIIDVVIYIVRILYKYLFSEEEGPKSEYVLNSTFDMYAKHMKVNTSIDWWIGLNSHVYSNNSIFRAIRGIE